MAINGLQQFREIDDKGRPGVSDKDVIRIVYYYLEGWTQVRIAQKLDYAVPTISKYINMYKKRELSDELMAQIEGYSEVNDIAKAYGVDNALMREEDSTGNRSLVSIQDVVNMDALIKIVSAAVREASGEHVREKITGKGIRRKLAQPGDVTTKFGYALDDDTKVILDLERQAPNPKNFMTITEFLKKNGIDVFESVRQQLGLNNEEKVDLSTMSPEEASAQYQQLMSGESND